MRWNRPVKLGARRSDPREGGKNALPPDQVDTADIGSAPALDESPDRVVTLTDGVVAIAMTLLVLDLAAIETADTSARELWDALAGDKGRFIAFFVAFLGDRAVLDSAPPGVPAHQPARGRPRSAELLVPVRH